MKHTTLTIIALISMLCLLPAAIATHESVLQKPTDPAFATKIAAAPVKNIKNQNIVAFGRPLKDEGIPRYYYKPPSSLPQFPSRFYSTGPEQYKASNYLNKAQNVGAPQTKFTTTQPQGTRTTTVVGPQSFGGKLTAGEAFPENKYFQRRRTDEAQSLTSTHVSITAKVK